MAEAMLMTMAVLAASGFCDTHAAPAPYVVASDNHRYYVKVYPEANTPWADPRGTVTAFEIQATEPDRKFWESSEWYGYFIMLCDDGRHVVRFDEDKVSFYEDGRLVKAYSNADLNTRGPWMGRPLPTFGAWPIERDLVRMTSYEQMERVFDLRTGDIVAMHADVPQDYSQSRSLRSPPQRSALDRFSRSSLLLIGGALVGIAVWFMVGYARWRARQRSGHGA